MKENFKKFIMSYLRFSDPRNAFSIFLIIASRITRDKNYKSRKNKIAAVLIIFSLIVSFFIYIGLYPYKHSGWKDLQRKYSLHTEIDYQDKEIQISLINMKDITSTNKYYVSVKLDDNGLAFKPLRYQGQNVKTDFLIYHRPIFIPWSEVKECIKVEYYNSYDKNASYKVRLKIENVDSLIELSVWEFFEPLCKQYNIQIFE